MIAKLLGGAARSLFNVGVLLLLAGGLCMYGAYRLLRAATVGAPSAPRRVAAFAVLTALVELGRTMKPPTPPPAHDDGGLVDYDDIRRDVGFDVHEPA